MLQVWLKTSFKTEFFICKGGCKTMPITPATKEFIRMSIFLWCILKIKTVHSKKIKKKMVERKKNPNTIPNRIKNLNKKKNVFFLKYFLVQNPMRPIDHCTILQVANKNKTEFCFNIFSKILEFEREIINCKSLLSTRTVERYKTY